MDLMRALQMPVPTGDNAFGRPAIQTRNAGAPELRQAVEAFEAMFVRMILEHGDQSQLAEGLLEGEKDNSFKSMLNAEYAQSVAGQADLGIASALYAQFAGTLPKVKG